MKNFSKIVRISLSVFLIWNSQIAYAGSTAVPADQTVSLCSRITDISEGIADQIARQARVNRDSVYLIRTYGRTQCWGVFNTDKGPVDRWIVGIRRDDSGIYYVTTIL